MTYWPIQMTLDYNGLDSFLMHRKTIAFTTVTLCVLGQHLCPIHAQEFASHLLFRCGIGLPPIHAELALHSAIELERLL